MSHPAYVLLLGTACYLLNIQMSFLLYILETIFSYYIQQRYYIATLVLANNETITLIVIIGNELLLKAVKLSRRLF